MVKRIVLMLVLLVAGISLNAQHVGSTVLRKTTGEKVTFREIVKDDWVVLVFWSTTCKPCLNELTALMAIENKWKGKIRIIAVSIDDARSVAKVRSLVKGRKWRFEVYIDENKRLYSMYNLTSIPTAMIIDKEGKSHYLHTGYTPGDEIVLMNKALKLIKKK